MKMSFLIGAGVGYVLGARAGRQRYEQIVANARKITGSQTFQSTAGVLQAQADELYDKAKSVITHSGPATPSASANGHHPG